jgi:hypothetical protein
LGLRQSSGSIFLPARRSNPPPWRRAEQSVLLYFKSKEKNIYLKDEALKSKEENINLKDEALKAEKEIKSDRKTLKPTYGVPIKL